jgi:hypothetical protein
VGPADDQRWRQAIGSLRDQPALMEREQDHRHDLGLETMLFPKFFPAAGGSAVTSRRDRPFSSQVEGRN